MNLARGVHGVPSPDSPPSPKSGTAPARKEPMLPARPKGGSRQQELDHLRAALKEKKGPSGTLMSHLEGMSPDSPVESWDRLFFELNVMRETGLADRIAVVCREMRRAAWTSASNDDDILSHILPMFAQFGYAGDDAAESLRFKLASMSSTVNVGLKPGEKMRAFMVNMARFGSMVDDRTIRMAAEEFYVKRGHLGRLCDICEDILRFSGRDRDRHMASTLVEDMIVAVLAELQGVRSRAYASSMDGGLFPLIAYIGEHLPDEVLDRCVRLLVRRANSLGLAVPPAPNGDICFLWAPALAHRISARTQRFGPDEIARHARRHHRRSYRFLGLNRSGAMSQLRERGLALAESASSEIALRGLAGLRDALPTGQAALGLLDLLQERTERMGIDVSPAVTRRWRSGMRGSRLWGSLLEMELHLRLRVANASVLATPAPGGQGVALELDGCRVEAYSPLDGSVPERGRGARAGGPGPGGAAGLPWHAWRGGEEGRIVLVVDCTVAAPAGLDAVAGMPPMALDSAGQPGALCLVRREWGRQERRILKNPHSAPQVSSATGEIERALGIDLAKPGNPAP